jgi:cytochrome P450/nitrite reductase/ring-hydroxylating ferredoxin subunit
MAAKNEAAAAAPVAPASESELAAIAGAERLTGDGPFAVSAGGVDLLLVRTKAGPRVFQGRCPHQGALLGEGELEGETVVCRNHRWRFSALDGRRQGGPQCLVACPVVEEAGQLLVDLAPLAAERPETERRRGLGDLPGPAGLPLLGNALDMDLPNLHRVVEGWVEKYGPLYTFRVGRRRTLAVADPALSQQVLRARPETFRRVSNLEPIFVELGVAGVFSAEGAAWRPQRRLAMEALSHRHLRGFYPTLRMVAERLRGRWEKAAERQDTLDVVEELKRFTVDVTTSLTFGKDVNTIEEAGDDVIQRRLELLFPAFNRRIMALVPLWRLIKLPRDRRLDRALAEVRTWLEGLVREARERLAVDPGRASHPSNFLEAMLAARDEAGRPFEDPVIFGNLMTMLLAGEDTTAFTLAWAVHQLCDSHATVEALRVELDEALGPDPVPGDIDTAGGLAYAGAIANETMRLRPVAPVLLFEAIVDTTLGDIAVPAQTNVLVLPRPPVLAHEHFYAAETFLPERWLEPISAGAHEPATHIPFGSGPRICPGRSLALLEMKLVLAMLYKNFEVVRVGESADVRELFAFTMGPQGLRVQLRRR